MLVFPYHQQRVSCFLAVCVLKNNLLISCSTFDKLQVIPCWTLSWDLSILEDHYTASTASRLLMCQEEQTSMYEIPAEKKDTTDRGLWWEKPSFLSCKVKHTRKKKKKVLKRWNTVSFLAWQKKYKGMFTASVQSKNRSGLKSRMSWSSQNSCRGVQNLRLAGASQEIWQRENLRPVMQGRRDTWRPCLNGWWVKTHKIGEAWSLWPLAAKERLLIYPQIWIHKIDSNILCKGTSSTKGGLRVGWAGTDH